MRTLLTCLVAITILATFNSCQKELSIEYGSPATGSLQSSGGDCLPKNVAGSYIANKTLTDSNFVEVTVNVLTPGPYTIFTDSLNGYSFKAAGTFNNTGSNTVKLKATGRPVSQGINNFTVFFDSSFCDIAVTVLPAGSTGGPAAFTLDGAPGGCSAFGLNGNYVKDSTLNLTHFIRLNVMVTTVGTYTINTTTVNGYFFSTSGTFGATGATTVTLQATGKPLAVGTDNFTATAGAASCTFPVTVTGTASAGSCTVTSLQGTYVAGVATTTANKITITHNYAAAATYAVSTNVVNGYSFAASHVGTVGANSITLNATGTPLAAGTNTFTVNFGDATTCTFTVTVTAPVVVNNDYFPLTANSYWTYNYDTGPADTFKVTNAGPTQVFSGQTYQRFVYANGATGVDFYRKDVATGFYYRSDDTAGYGAQGLTFSQARLDILFLKNTLTTGDSLVSNFNSVLDIGGGVTFNGTFRVKFKVINSNASVTINGRNFTTVYQLRAFYEFGVAGNFIDITADPTDFYYVRGVGLISSENSTDFQDIRFWQVN